MSSIRQSIDWVTLFAVTAIWFVLGGVAVWVPVLGPVFIGRAFIEAHVDHQVPVIAMLVMVLGVTFGQLASACLLINDIFAFGQIFLFALTCVIVWCRNYYIAWRSRSSS